MGAWGPLGLSNCRDCRDVAIVEKCILSCDDAVSEPVAICRGGPENLSRCRLSRPCTSNFSPKHRRTKVCWEHPETSRWPPGPPALSPAGSSTGCARRFLAAPAGPGAANGTGPHKECPRRGSDGLETRGGALNAIPSRQAVGEKIRMPFAGFAAAPTESGLDTRSVSKSSTNRQLCRRWKRYVDRERAAQSGRGCVWMSAVRPTGTGTSPPPGRRFRYAKRI